MRIGNKWFGVEIAIRDGALFLACWRPIAAEHLSERDSHRINLTGEAHDSVRFGNAIEYGRFIGPPEKAPR